jgi:hypothetical protein
VENIVIEADGRAGRNMPYRDDRPPLALILVSLTIGALDHSAWYLGYACLLFAISVAIGFKWPRPVWPWLMILAAGAPVINIIAHTLFGFQAGYPVVEDAGARFLAAFVAMLPGLAVGMAAHRVAERLMRREPLEADGQPSTIA